MSYYRFVNTPYKDGRVSEAVRLRSQEGADPESEAKIVFEYTDIAVDPARYALMINAHIMEQENNY